MDRKSLSTHTPSFPPTRDLSLILIPRSYSGTSGHIVRNLSSVRPREGPPGAHSKPGDFSTGANSLGPPIHRQPDKGILDHERKRKIEVRCLELREELEEKG